MSAPLSPTLEILEDRITPTTYGIPWPDPQHLTVSFVPDGTAIGSPESGQSQGPYSADESPETSDLCATLAADGLTCSVWQGQILSALQTWAAATNIDLTVVPDSGAPLGTAGALEGDPNFGDIRIAAAPLSCNLLATTSPFDPQAGSWSGDIILNSTDRFGIGPTAPLAYYDLYSVVLHEAGHAFGLADKDCDPSSVMFGYYNGVRTGLSAVDQTAIQRLYGAPTPDPWASVPGGNATPGTATNFNRAVVQQDLTNLVQAGNGADAALSIDTINADLSTPKVEYFRYQNPSPGSGFTVSVQTAGQSLLEANLTVLNQNGQVVGSATATNPENGDLVVPIANAGFGANYTIEVRSANGSGVFGVGSYLLQVKTDSSQATWMEEQLLQMLQQYDVPHDSMASAGLLQSLIPGGRLATTSLTLDSASDVSFMRVQAPPASAGSDGSLTVFLWTSALGDIPPSLTLLNAYGVVQPTTVETQGDGAVVLRLDHATPGATYFVKVGPATGSLGGAWNLAVEFGSRPPNAPQVQSGTLTQQAAQANSFFGLAESGVVQLQASAQIVTPPASGAQTLLEMTVLDASGNVWFDTTFAPGQAVNATVLLPAGNYEVRITEGMSDHSPPGTVNYQVLAKLLNAPIGPPLTNPDEPPPPPSEHLWLQFAPFAPILATHDAYGQSFQYQFSNPPS